MQEIASSQGKAIPRRTRVLYICKAQKQDDEMVEGQETCNLETLVFTGCSVIQKKLKIQLA